VALLLVCVAIAGVRAGARYARGRVRDELRRRVEKFAESSGLSVELGEVRLVDSNKLSVRNVSVSCPAEGAGQMTLARVPEVEVKANLLSALLRRSFPMTVTLFNPQVSLERRADGTWTVPSFEGALSRHNGYPFIAYVRSGRLDVRQEGKSDYFCAENINLSLRSSANRRALRLKSTFSIPNFSDNPSTIEGWIYPAERRFDFRHEAEALDAVAVNKLIADSPLRIEGGVMDCTLGIRGVIGKSIAVQGPVAFNTLQVAGVPRFLGEIDATAEVSFKVDYETKEVSLEKFAIDAGSSRGSVGGTLSFGAGEPTVHLEGQFDRFPAEELARMMVDKRFPAVSETRINLEQKGSLAIEIDGKITEPRVDLVASCPASRAAFKVETDRYETVDASMELAETVFSWNPTEGVSLDTAVSDGTLQGGSIPYVIKELGGRISFRDGSARAHSLTMLVDDLPITVSGYADVSGSGVPAAQATIRCTIDDLARTKYASPLKDLRLSGPAVLTAQLQKLDESVRWDVDADLKEAEVLWRDAFHKPAGMSARLRLSDAVPVQKVSFRASLGQSNVAGSATVGGGETPTITALTVESETLHLAELAPLLKLPIEVREEAGTKLALAVNAAATGRPGITAGLSADQLAVTLLEAGRTEPLQIEFEDIATTLKTDANGYQTDLRCATVKLSSTIHTLAKGGYRPEYPARLTSPVRIVASIDRFVAEPCEMNQLECEILLSGSQWVLSAATGHVADGTFELSGSMMHDEGTFSFEYGCDGFEISEVMCWMPDGAQGISGALSAKMSLSGTLGSAGSRSGQGTLTVTDGEIDSSHVISRTQGSENGSEPGPIQFDTLRCDFSLDNDTLNVSNLLVEKPGLRVHGRGTITLDGQVDQTFDVEISRSMAEQLSTKKRWGLLDELVGGLGQVLPLPRLTQDPIKRTFTVKGTVGSLETEVERGPLYVELVRATFAFSESVVVSGVTVLALPARMFTDVLAWANGL
jgi:hypothetical protein